MMPHGYTIHLPHTRPPLTSNQRFHWRKKASITADLRLQVHRLLMLANVPPMRKAQIELVWVVKDRRRRDVDNVVPTLKVCADAAVDAGVIQDDTPEFCVKVMPTIKHDPWADTAHLELRITEVY